ncbi:MAG: NAD(P)H-dependent oxidoreductase [Deltaproteobacteria bacterium]|nr:NAD(P)H-dependent oxidoreductase [Deltaproteobacteria bacterium]
MPTIFDVHALPRGAKSRTRRLRDAFLGAYRERHGEAVRHVELDLARDHGTLPVFDEWDIQARLEVAFGEGDLDEESARRWAALTKLTDQLHACDVLLLSCPMWNFSVPWYVKRWIDCVVQAKLTFEVKDGQYQGLLGGRSAVVVTTRDGSYPEGSPLAAFDFQVPYLRMVLGFVGFSQVRVVVAEPMAAAGPAVAEDALRQAIDASAAVAREI